MIECDNKFIREVQRFSFANRANMNSRCSLYSHTLSVCILVLSASLFSACGGGGIGGTGREMDVLPTGLLIGPIDSTDLFSINDTQFDVVSTSVTVNGVPASYAALEPGMNVTARVNYEEESIESIDYQPLVVGPVDSLADDKSSFVALGQMVKITENTRYGNQDLEGVYQDAIVEVSGIRDADNNIIASFVGLESTIDQQFIIGVVEAPLDEANDMILSGTTVSLDTIFEENNVSSTVLDSTLTPGSSIKVEVDVGVDTSGDTVESSEIQIVENILPVSNEQISVNGVVRSVVNPQSFVLGKFIVYTGELTQYFDRSGERLVEYVVGENDVILVTGTVIADGDVFATNVKVKSATQLNADNDGGVN